MSVRAAGLLVHPTSLPGPFGTGDFGPESETFSTGSSRPVSLCGKSCPSDQTRATTHPPCCPRSRGNPLLISPQRLYEQGLLTASDLDAPEFPEDRLDRERLAPWKEALLRRSWDRCGRVATIRRSRARGVLPFPAASHWLEDWALFSALKGASRTGPGPSGLRDFAREPNALSAAFSARLRDRLSPLCPVSVWRQWSALRRKLIARDPIWRYAVYGALEGGRLGEPAAIRSGRPGKASNCGRCPARRLHRDGTAVG